MIQIIGLRPTFRDPRTDQVKNGHKLFLEVESVPTLFENIEDILKSIPETEKWNLYFTALDCQDPGVHKKKLRRFKTQKIIPFDIDGIKVEEFEKYIPIVLETLGVAREKTGIVFTGNGLQFHIELQEAFNDVKFFQDKRPHYKAICETLNRGFEKAGLPGNADPAVWSPARLLRLPGTENRKPPPKGTTRATLVQAVIQPQNFILEKVSGIPELGEGHHISDWSPKQQPDVDHKEILKTCAFLKDVHENPKDCREPQFYAASSILARMENGVQRCHNLQEMISESGSDSTVGGYAHSEVESKIEQALKASGPRTCIGIDAVWGKCNTCIHWQKITSPIQIKGQEFIATRKTGFHKIQRLANGQAKMVPDNRDLLKYFDQKYFHKTNEGGIVFVYQNKRFQRIERSRIKAYAQKHFNPPTMPHLPECKDIHRKEFCSLVESTSLVPQEFFIVRGKLNVKNGILDLKTLELKPHTPEYGFQYVLGYDYDPEAKCPKFDQFMSQICCGNQELQDTLLEYMGYALSGENCWAQKALLLTGEGANGKSTFINLLTELAGRENVSALALKSMDKPTSVSLMEDKLFNISEETPQGKTIESNEIKNLITGGKVEARHLYKDAYFMENKAKLIFACNDLPQVKDTSGGWYRRFIIVPFEAQFDEDFDPANQHYKANRQILKELLPERSGILNQVVKAYQRLLKNKAFTDPGASRDAMGQYKLESDPMRYWLFESGRVVVHPLNGGKQYSTLRELYSSYCLTMETEGQDRPMSIAKFGRRIQNLLQNGNIRRSVKRVGSRCHKVILDVSVQELES